MTDSPALGYNGTSGHQAADTSRDAVRADDESGRTNELQQYILHLARVRREVGVTVKEVRDRMADAHHGKVSSALTNLHKAGHLAALRERRTHCGVYVLPEHVGDREVRPFRPNRPQIDHADMVTLLQGHTSVGGWQCRCGVYTHSSAGHRDHVAEVIIAEFGR